MESETTNLCENTCTDEETMSSELANKIVTDGKLYNPAKNHYNNEAAVKCDRCNRYDILCCIGYDDTDDTETKFYDLCLPCAGIVSDMIVYQKTGSNPTFSQQSFRISDDTIKNIHSHGIYNGKPSSISDKYCGHCNKDLSNCYINLNEFNMCLYCFDKTLKEFKLENLKSIKNEVRNVTNEMSHDDIMLTMRRERFDRSNVMTLMERSEYKRKIKRACCNII
jgi:hypothetical protein